MAGEKSGRKSGRNAGSFAPGGDSRQGRGPRKGAPNAGRPPNAFREHCRQVSDRIQLAEIAGKIAAAEILENVYANDGTLLYSDCKNSDRLAAAKFLASYGEGMPAQSIDLTSKGESLKPVIIRQAAP